MTPGRLTEYRWSVWDQVLAHEMCCAGIILHAEQACSSSGAASQMHFYILIQASWENRLHITVTYSTCWRIATRKKKCKWGKKISGKRRYSCQVSFFRHSKGSSANSFVFSPQTRQQWDWTQEKAQCFYWKPHTLLKEKPVAIAIHSSPIVLWIKGMRVLALIMDQCWQTLCTSHFNTLSSLFNRTKTQLKHCNVKRCFRNS